MRRRRCPPIVLQLGTAGYTPVVWQRRVLSGTPRFLRVAVRNSEVGCSAGTAGREARLTPLAGQELVKSKRH